MTSQAGTLLLYASLLAACQGNGEAPGVSLVVATMRDAVTLDPAAINDAESMQVATQIFEPLVRYEPVGARLRPALAVRWKESDDQRSWTFHLRREVRFHDGSPLDADAVVLSFERQRDVKHRFHFGGFFYWESAFSYVERVERVDRYTVRIRMKRPHAPFLHHLATFPVGIVSPGALQRRGKGFARHPEGTGPFVFDSWQPGRRIKLRRNPSYWGRKPQVTTLTFEVVPDSRQRLLGLESGRVDVAPGLAPAERQIVILHPELKLHRLPGNDVAYLAMNTSRWPFNNLRIRKAVNHAVNRRAVVKLVYQGLAVEAIGPLPPGMWSRNTGVSTYAYDPERARALLQEARYQPTRRPRLFVTNEPRPYLPSPLLVARMVARNLADAGIPVEVVVLPFDQYLRAVQEGKHDLCLAGWTGDIWDPDNFLYTLLDSDNARRGAARNHALYSNEKVHNLLAAARQEHQQTIREQLYKQAQEIIADEAPWVPLAHPNVDLASQAAVSRLMPTSSMAISYRDVIKSAGRAGR